MTAIIVKDTAKLMANLTRFVDVCGSDLMVDTWSSFSCEEVEVICDLLESVGALSAAQMVREQHSYGDEIGDRHYEEEEDGLTARTLYVD